MKQTHHRKRNIVKSNTALLDHLWISDEKIQHEMLVQLHNSALYFSFDLGIFALWCHVGNANKYQRPALEEYFTVLLEQDRVPKSKVEMQLYRSLSSNEEDESKLYNNNFIGMTASLISALRFNYHRNDESIETIMLPAGTSMICPYLYLKGWSNETEIIIMRSDYAMASRNIVSTLM